MSLTIEVPHAKSPSLGVLILTLNLALFLPQTINRTPPYVLAGTGGGSMLGDVNISAILDSFSVGYDKRVRPNYGGPPVEVGVTMYVLSISSLSEVKMDFTLDFYFRQFWTDPRLAYRKRPGVETLSVGSEFIKNIWVPDTFFVNEKQSYFHIATTSNEFIRIHHSGSITRSIRLTITASCPMNLQYFPMDRQLCHIEIESFGYTMRDIRYKWNEGPNSVGVSSEVSLPQFKVLGHRQRAMEISLTTEYATVGYMAKRIQMRKQRFMAIQKIAEQKKQQAADANHPPPPPPVASDHSHGHGHGHSHTHQHTPKQQMGSRSGTMQNVPPNMGSRGCSIVGPLFQEVRFKVHDPKAHSKGGTLENTINGGRGGGQPGGGGGGGPPGGPPGGGGGGPDEESVAPQHLIHPGKDINKLLGITPSDIDKYSRIVFPVCFVCFNLMYWIIYLHVSDVVADDLVLLGEEK
ncbi:gamma-aminobutyric acid receptor subunit beta isoform X5 [Anopheles funestus]|uniref:gamma-aminobutyric acid receptor subunit beta isoform X5 n=1 Tax=Anopheles funestus TaxID=62324 RepID=UPI0020C6AC2E|nr:gamma-aminobutyric acid receptor subunit beta isoform X5 [Anopheles funestus]